MNNFIVRTITAIIFVAVIVASFLRAETMILLFALVSGMTIWEFTRLVNDRPQVTVNRMITTITGVYLFFAMAGFCSELAPSGVFIPYLISIIYLMVAELYLKHEDPIHDWAYTMMSQLYIALPFSLLNALAFHLTPENEVVYDPAPLHVRLPLDQRCRRLYLRFVAGQAQALPPYLSRQELGGQHRRRHPRDARSSVNPLPVRTNLTPHS